MLRLLTVNTLVEVIYMKEGYRKLGDIIRQTDERNVDLKVTKLMGVNLSKEFIPSVANIIGTDLTKYKIVRKNQFACKLMSVGRDMRLPIAYKTDDEPIIISSAYFSFEVIDENVVLSDYLMMCFSRTEFERELWFYSGGDVRGGINWETFCNVELPIPSINEQRKKVKAYKAITDRIALKKQINDNLAA